MKLDTLHDLLVHELRDIHSAELQIIEALPNMVKAARAQVLKTAFKDHLTQTKQQLERVKGLLDEIGASPGKTKCVGIAGIIKEASEMIDEEGAPAVKDAGLICMAQRVEHYEISAYMSAVGLAEGLGLGSIARTLEEIQDEEVTADELLASIADKIHSAALDAESTESARGERGGARG
jgi:ferritin-like metal-binding protein YciE